MAVARKLQHALSLFHRDFDFVCHQHPEVASCLRALEAAVVDSFPMNFRRAGRLRGTFVQKLKRSENKREYINRKVKRLQEELYALKYGKRAKHQGRMTPEFLAKVSLAWPTTCASNFHAAWQDLVGTGVAGCARSTITNIRDAFAEVVKQQSSSALSSMLAAGFRAKAVDATVLTPEMSAASSAEALPVSSAALAPASSMTFPVVALLHIHDEASLRLRSSADIDSAAPARSRSSKVQQHSVYVHGPSASAFQWPSELHPLANKTAAVLATSLRQVLLQVVECIGVALNMSATNNNDVRAWLLHILVSDGLNTNEAAAKILRAWLLADPLGHRLRYFVILVKCANHQANLVVGSVVEGRAAVVANNNAARQLGARPFDRRGAVLRQDSAASGVCGAIVRLFKYLMNDYYSEFLANLADVVAGLRFVDAVPPQEDASNLWADLHTLYGESVLPRALLHYLNTGLGQFVHVSAALAPAAAALAPAQYQEEIRDGLLELLRSRILVVDEHPTYSRMFTFAVHVDCMLLLMFLGIFSSIVRLRGTKPKERNRKRVDKVLGFFKLGDAEQYLRRTSLSLSLVMHIHRTVAQLRLDKEPLLVRLSKGEVGNIVGKDLYSLLGRLHLDPALDGGACVALLLSTSSELCVRFLEYSRWPYRSWSLTKMYNPDGYIVDCAAFLECDIDTLDHGFGQPLRKLAQKLRGSKLVDQLDYLLSASVQEAVVLAFEASAVSSLPAERVFAELKRSEAPRLCHVATAGRNRILRQHYRQRSAIVAEAEKCAATLRRSLATNVQSLAWELQPHLATQALSRDSAAMRQYIDANRVTLEAEVNRRQAVAKAAAKRISDPERPVTKSQWLSWFRRHEDTFYEQMKDASVKRRQMNRRLMAPANVPQGVRQLGADVKFPPKRDLPRWQQFLVGRSGWFCVKAPGVHMRLLFLCTCQRRTYCIDWTFCRNGSTFDIVFAEDYLYRDLLQPLHLLEVDVLPTMVAEAVVTAELSPTRASLSVTHAKELLYPLQTRRKGKKRAKDSLGEDASESASSARCDSDEGVKRDAVDSCTASSVPSVDTDVDSDVDEVPSKAGLEEARSKAARSGGRPDVVESASDGEGASNSGAAAVAPEVAAAAVAPGLPRHAPGTFKFEENAYFYFTKTPGYSDIKVIMKNPFRNSSGGMGTSSMSKTLSPHMFDESWDSALRTVVLLRAWCIWRARMHGWAAARECRLREINGQEQRLFNELMAQTPAPPSRPLLGNEATHALLAKWVPDVVQRILASA